MTIFSGLFVWFVYEEILYNSNSTLIDQKLPKLFRKISTKFCEQK